MLMTVLPCADLFAASATRSPRVLICGVRRHRRHGGVANTGFMTRSVVVLGYPGVQALDLVGPFEVFTGATLCLASQGRGDEGYRVTVVSRGRRAGQHRHRAGAGRPAAARPASARRHRRAARRCRGGRRPAEPRRHRLDPGRRRQRPPRRQRLHRRVPGRGGGSARRLPGDHALGVRRSDGTRIPLGGSRSRADLRAQLVDGVDGGGRHRRHRPGAVVGRGRLRHRRRADRGPLAGDVPAAPRRPNAVRRPGVDAARQGGHRSATCRRPSSPNPVAHTASPSWPAAPR